jgi:hypothetical protein
MRCLVAIVKLLFSDTFNPAKTTQTLYFLSWPQPKHSLPQHTRYAS